MAKPHKLVSGKKVDLSPEEIAEYEAQKQEHQAKLDREAELAPLKSFYQYRKNAYSDRLGGTPQEQLGAILEAGSLQGLKAVYDKIRTVDYPWTDELRALKDSCTPEELNKVRN